MHVEDVLKSRLDETQYRRLIAIENPMVHEFVAEYIALCDPASVFVCTDDGADLKRIREKAVELGEEQTLAIPGHTIHFDGYKDQARDKDHTKILLPRGVNLGENIESMDREEGVAEVRDILKNLMQGKEMIVRFFCLGPMNSAFTILACQITDSYYVAHSLDLLYRQGYEAFKTAPSDTKCFRIVHSQGELENCVSKNIDKRRVYVDVEDEIVYSANTQYGGNTLGLKKLSMRLAIKRASREDWLCEHMFVMGVHGPKDRLTYFTGAFPSLCGKTSTSMMTGEKIIGDDIAYLRPVDGEMRAVNVEKGMFGIIMGINSKDDPIIWETLHNPNEIIFSNILVADDRSTYWIDKDGPVPSHGFNHSGPWTPGKKDAAGKTVDPSHKNARFTLDLKCLENVDERIDDPEGVKVGGVIYGGRDSHAWVPVRESFDWVHGIVTIGAALESETTAATLGKEGVPVFNPMSNIDFVSVPLGLYIKNNLDFGARLSSPPLIFGVNYFLTDAEGRWLNEKTDKAIWLKWMELRVHGDADALVTPVGKIPRYEDLRKLFEDVQGKSYAETDYVKQFTVRVDAFTGKIKRIIAVYRNIPDTPAVVFEALQNEIDRLEQARAKHGDLLKPELFA
ncbi:MAG TPA: phosphoenolpyruvate carboxykinase (GTP) [bacterium]|nr:phosphoenolpyruvate carboxykinase (GTP) [bacterium]